MTIDTAARMPTALQCMHASHRLVAAGKAATLAYYLETHSKDACERYAEETTRHLREAAADLGFRLVPIEPDAFEHAAKFHGIDPAEVGERVS